MKRLIALFAICCVVMVTSVGCGGETSKKDTPKPGGTPAPEKKT